MQGPSVPRALESYDEDAAVLGHFELGQIVLEGGQPTGGQKSSKALQSVRVRFEGGFQSLAGLRECHGDRLLEIAVSHRLRQARDVRIDLRLSLSEVGRGEISATPLGVDFLAAAASRRLLG